VKLGSTDEFTVRLFKSPKGHRRNRFRGHDVACFKPSTKVAAKVTIVGAMKRKSIFKNESQKLDAAFIEAGLPEKVLLVPLDFAKLTHYACFCDGRGRYVRNAFPVKNNRAGIDYLIDQIERTRKARGIRSKQHVIIGGEDSASYTCNFMDQLFEQGYLTVRLNAKEVHQQAESLDSSTDKTALRAIAKTMLNRDARLTTGSDQYAELRGLTRQRRRIVHLSTAVKNRIHSHADRLFPGFLSKGSAVAPFSKASLQLMEKSFSATAVRRRSEKVLTRQLSGQGVREPALAAAQLKEQAANAICADDNSVRLSAQLIAGELRLYQTLQSTLSDLDRECARILAQLPEAFVLSVKGIGITLCASIFAEIGSLSQVQHCDQINAYAGIVPKVKQTGGPEAPARIGGKRRSFNRALKDYTLQAGNHLYLHGPKELMEDAARRKLQGKAVDTAMARRFLRIARALTKSHNIYLPTWLRADQSETDSEERAQYILQTWPDLLIKWKRLGLHHEAFAPEAPLGRWRGIVQEIYDIELPL
jgi:transposase